MFKQGVINSVPNYWLPGSHGNYNGQFILSPFSQEYHKVEEVFNDHHYYEQNICEIKRVQNVDFYAKFLLGKQQMATYESIAYTRRMIVVLPQQYLPVALKHNLDVRRIPIEIRLQLDIQQPIPKDCVVLMVNVLYSTQRCLYQKSHSPGFSSDHYIEYIIKLN